MLYDPNNMKFKTNLQGYKSGKLLFWGREYCLGKDKKEPSGVLKMFWIFMWGGDYAVIKRHRAAYVDLCFLYKGRTSNKDNGNGDDDDDDDATWLWGRIPANGLSTGNLELLEDVNTLLNKNGANKENLSKGEDVAQW